MQVQAKIITTAITPYEIAEKKMFPKVIEFYGNEMYRLSAGFTPKYTDKQKYQFKTKKRFINKQGFVKEGSIDMVYLIIIRLLRLHEKASVPAMTTYLAGFLNIDEIRKVKDISEIDYTKLKQTDRCIRDCGKKEEFCYFCYMCHQINWSKLMDYLKTSWFYRLYLAMHMGIYESMSTDDKEIIKGYLDTKMSSTPQPSEYDEICNLIKGDLRLLRPDQQTIQVEFEKLYNAIHQEFGNVKFKDY